MVVMVVSGWIAVGLVHDIAFPPSPKCEFPAKYQPAKCMLIPNDAALSLYTYPLDRPSPTSSWSTQSSAGPSAAPTGSTADEVWSSDLGGVSVDGTILIERGIRTFQLAIALAILVASLWFCRRMLTGRWVAAIRPVHHRVSDE